MNPTKTEAVARFLTYNTIEDLAQLYNYNMEVQVNVAQDEGRRIGNSGDYKGKRWVGFEDENGIDKWFPFRIPHNANTEPNYEDKPLTFDLNKHAEGIGMTGWDWVNKLSRWIAYDFDAITGHSQKHDKKLTDIELKQIQDLISNIDWCTIRYSTSGNGLHIYVFLDPPVPTATHTEHAALARSILGMISAKTGINLEAKVDAMGQNMWIWHRKMKGTNGLQVIKKGVSLTKVPENWRDHLKVITGKRKKVSAPSELTKDYDTDKLFDELSGSRSRVSLDEDHRKLIDYVEKSEFSSWYDADNNMLVTHTYALKLAHKDLKLKGIYDTLSEGQDATQNCFAYPIRGGAWVVRRYTTNVAEKSNWDRDQSGFTRCYFNKEPDLKTLSVVNQGVEHPQGGFHFNDAMDAQKVIEQLGSTVKIPTWAQNRSCKLKYNKDKKLVVDFQHSQTDSSNDVKDWILERGHWKKVLDVKDSTESEIDIGNYDDIIRHIIDSEGNDMGWVIYTDGQWRTEPISHVSIFLKALGLDKEQLSQVLGSAVIRPWTIINKPFDMEYPGDRLWNRRAPQFNFPPNTDLDNLHYPSWLAILTHIGQNLDMSVKDNEWCKMNGITTGADYLKCWVASVFQQPTEPLPYLFLYSQEQNTGKSILHEALSLLVTSGVVRADQALGDSNFNGELENAVIGVIEETDIGTHNKSAYNKIKDWVTSRHLPINRKYETPYTIVNTLHFIHCSNNATGVPIFPGDTRIVMVYVSPLEEVIPKREFIKRLTKEAPDFLAAILHLELPECNDRLALPVLKTTDKTQTEDDNKSLVDIFIEEATYEAPGNIVNYNDFYNAFQTWLDPNDLPEWTKIKFGKHLNKIKYPKARDPRTSQWAIGNISLTPHNNDYDKFVIGQNNTFMRK